MERYLRLRQKVRRGSGLSYYEDDSVTIINNGNQDLVPPQEAYDVPQEADDVPQEAMLIDTQGTVEVEDVAIPDNTSLVQAMEADSIETEPIASIGEQVQAMDVDLHEAKVSGIQVNTELIEVGSRDMANAKMMDALPAVQHKSCQADAIDVEISETGVQVCIELELETEMMETGVQVCPEVQECTR